MTDQAQCDELLAALIKRPMTAMEILLELGIGRWGDHILSTLAARRTFVAQQLEQAA